jgi:hypothetical protein
MFATKRVLKRSFVPVVPLALIGFVLLSGAHNEPAFAQQTIAERLTAQQRRAIQLIISSHAAPVDFFISGHVIDRSVFLSGEPVHIGLVMTNTSGESLWVCAFSNPFYQNRPQLTRDGEPVPYLETIIELSRQSDAGELCELFRTPDVVCLKENVPFRAHTIELNDWYGPLEPGHYELFLRRTFACCADGRWNTTNVISFDVTG